MGRLEAILEPQIFTEIFDENPELQNMIKGSIRTQDNQSQAIWVIAEVGFFPPGRLGEFSARIFFFQER